MEDKIQENAKIVEEKKVESNVDIERQEEANRISMEKVKAVQSQQSAFKERLGVGGNE